MPRKLDFFADEQHRISENEREEMSTIKKMIRMREDEVDSPFTKPPLWCTR
jgi:hypothetical protein